MSREDGEKVLVVEDDPDLREVLQVALTRAGYAVHTAADGVEGLAALERVEPDIVVLDVLMPRMDGLEMCRRMRMDARHRLRPVIVLSVRAEVSDRVVGLEIGADDYIPKPVDPATVVAHVRRRLRATTERQAQVRSERQAALESLAVAVCHELNSPLAALAYEVHVALDDPHLQANVAAALGRMRALIERMQMILDRVARARDEPIPYVEGTDMTRLEPKEVRDR